MHYAPSPATSIRAPAETTMQPSTLASLRRLIPTRESIAFNESLRVAELQAAKLLSLFDINDGPVPSELITELPRLRVVYGDLPASGTSHWNGEEWIITLNRHEAHARQRLTLAHEYKHIIDHGSTKRLYTGSWRHSEEAQSEQAADYFAGCLLVPRRLLKRAWGNGIQSPDALARHFNVSVPAITVRLAQTGLTTGSSRCARPIRSTTAQQFRTIRRYA